MSTKKTDSSGDESKSNDHSYSNECDDKKEDARERIENSQVTSNDLSDEKHGHFDNTDATSSRVDGLNAGDNSQFHDDPSQLSAMQNTSTQPSQVKATARSDAEEAVTSSAMAPSRNSQTVAEHSTTTIENDEVGQSGHTLDSLLSDINIEDSYSSQLSALANISPEIDEFISSLSAPTHEPSTTATSSGPIPPISQPSIAAHSAPTVMPIVPTPPTARPGTSTTSELSSNHSSHSSVHINQNSSSNSNNNSFNNSNVSNTSSATPAPRMSILAVATPTDLEAIPFATAQPNGKASIQTPSVPLAVATPLRNSNQSSSQHQGARNSSFLTEEGEEQVESVQRHANLSGILRETSEKVEATGEEMSKIGDSHWFHQNKRLAIILAILIAGISIVAIVIPIASKISSSVQGTPTVTLESSNYNPHQPLPLASTYICPLTSANTTTCQWKQFGNDLVGPTDGDLFGSKLRLGHTQKGTRFSVSAPFYDDAKGLTRVYDIVETVPVLNAGSERAFAFHQVGQDMISNSTNDKLEGIMSDDGYTLILASTDVSYDGKPHVGYVGAYFLNASIQWSPIGNPMYGQSTDGNFGRVEINRDGTVLIVSDTEYDFDHPTGKHFENAGLVLVFSLNTERNKWDLLGDMMAGLQANGRKGSSLSVSMMKNPLYKSHTYIIAIGAPENSNWGTEGDDYGKVTLSHLDSMYNDWMEHGQFIVGDEKDDKFGIEVELSADGSTVAIGTSAKWRDEESGVEGVGMVRIYLDSHEKREWLPLGNNIMSGHETQLDFGYEIRLSDDGKRVAIGQSRFSPSEELFEAGRVQVYDYYAKYNKWIQVGDDIIGERNCDHVGVGFDLSPDGSRLVVGFPNVASLDQDVGDCSKRETCSPVKGIVRLFELQLQRNR